MLLCFIEKVFKKINFLIHKSDIEGIINVTPGTIERVLYQVYCRITNYEEEKRLNKLTKKSQNQDESPLPNDKEINPAIVYAK